MQTNRFLIPGILLALMAVMYTPAVFAQDDDDDGNFVFNVTKDYTDLKTTEVMVQLDCLDEPPVDTRGVVTEDSTTTVLLEATLTYEDADGAFADCRVIEDPVPAGYTVSYSGECSALIQESGSADCLITNTQNPMDIMVTKIYEVPHPSGFDPQVEITLTCPTATVDGVPMVNSKFTTGDPVKSATFVVTNMPSGGETCVAAEAVPLGYVQLDVDAECDNLRAFPPGPAPSCTIYNNPTHAVLIIDKIFSDGNPDLSATVTALCVDQEGGPEIIYDSSDTGMSSDFTSFAPNILFFNGATNCTASELAIPGYTMDETPANSTCIAGVPISDDNGDNTCTITNLQDPIMVTVNKTYSAPLHPTTPSPAVDITLTCPSALIDGGASPVTKPTMTGVATFEVSMFPSGGEDCFATETVPAGYVETSNDCGTLNVVPAGTPPECTINNRPTEALFTVDKNFSDMNSQLAVVVTPECADQGSGPGITYDPPSGNAKLNTNFVSTVRFFDGGATCGAMEVDPIGYTQDPMQSTCDVPDMPVNDTTDRTCVIFNQQDPVTILASKVYTGEGGGAAIFDAACGEPSDLAKVKVSAVPGDPAVFIVSDFPWDGIQCDVTEPVPPPGFFEVGSTCNGLTIVPSDDDTLCNITNAPSIARFRVTKDFTDDNFGGPPNRTEVDVTLDCYTGLPIMQTQTISQTRDVEFIIKDFTHLELDCMITEDTGVPELDGYTPTYYAGIQNPHNSPVQSSAIACEYTMVEGGVDYSCHIQNDADPVRVAVEKEWIIEISGGTGNYTNTDYMLTLYCDAPIEGGKKRCKGGFGGFRGSSSGGGGYESCKEFGGDDDMIFTNLVTPEWPSSECCVGFCELLL